MPRLFHFSSEMTLQRHMLGVAVICCGAAVLATASDSAAALERLRKEQPGVTWNAKTAVIADVLCSGQQQVVVAGTKSRRKVVIAVVSKVAAEQPTILEFALNSRSQAAFCAAPTQIKSYPLDCDADGEKLPGCSPRKGCSGFSVTDDQCDSFNFYWNSRRKSLEWWRR